MTSMLELELNPKLDFRKFRLFLNCFILEPIHIVTAAEGIFLRSSVCIFKIFFSRSCDLCVLVPVRCKTHTSCCHCFPWSICSILTYKSIFSVGAFNGELQVSQISSYFWVIYVVHTHMSSKTKWPEKIKPYHFSLFFVSLGICCKCKMKLCWCFLSWQCTRLKLNIIVSDHNFLLCGFLNYP